MTPLVRLSGAWLLRGRSWASKWWTVRSTLIWWSMLWCEGGSPVLVAVKNMPRVRGLPATNRDTSTRILNKTEVRWTRCHLVLVGPGKSPRHKSVPTKLCVVPCSTSSRRRLEYTRLSNNLLWKRHRFRSVLTSTSKQRFPLLHLVGQT